MTIYIRAAAALFPAAEFTRARNPDGAYFALA
jgi:hypothetical protein